MILSLLQDVRVIENFGTSEYAGQTNLHPVGAAITGISSILTIMLPRRWAYVPGIMMACFLPQGQQIAILGLNFHLLRIFVVFAGIRILLRGEQKGLRLHALDLLVIAFAITRMLIYTTLYGQMSALVYQLGLCMDVIGLYFTTRCLIRNSEDLVNATVAFAWASIPIAVFFLIERSTGRNLFAVFGGVSPFTAIRDDKLRCQGPFAHPILAGCFWASLMPLFAALWWRPGYKRILALVGEGTSLLIIFCCNSSTPVAGVMFAAIGAMFFALRRQMLFVRITILVTLIALHMAMKAPVWHLISRVTLAQGSTSYFRYMLIDKAISHFDEWAALGTKSTAHWFYGGQDITNQYILEGVTGGFISLILFVAIISKAFGALGRLRKLSEGRRPELYLVWALGVSLLVHCMNFIGVSYFGQTILVWYFTLGAIGSLYERSFSAPMPAPALRRRTAATHPERLTT